jgi:hypothetical protein
VRVQAGFFIKFTLLFNLHPNPAIVLHITPDFVPINDFPAHRMAIDHKKEQLTSKLR